MSKPTQHSLDILSHYFKLEGAVATWNLLMSHLRNQRYERFTSRILNNLTEMRPSELRNVINIIKPIIPEGVLMIELPRRGSPEIAVRSNYIYLWCVDVIVDIASGDGQRKGTFVILQTEQAYKHFISLVETNCVFHGDEHRHRVITSINHNLSTLKPDGSDHAIVWFDATTSVPGITFIWK